MSIPGFISPEHSPYDVPLGEIKDKNKELTGMERVSNIFKVNEFGLISPELNMISQAAAFSAFAGVIYGGFMNTRSTYTDFVRNNQAVIYQNHLDAKRKLQDTFTKQYAAGAFKWGWRLCYFTTTYVGISTCISTYRNKNGILDHSIAGLVTGFSYKLSMGPRAWLVGAGLGCVLGTFAGSITVLLLKLAGVSMQDVKETHYKLFTKREDSERHMMQEYMRKEQISILTDHDDRIGDAGKTLEALSTVLPNTSPEKSNA